MDNFDETTGNPLARPYTLLIDSEELESGEALDDKFRAMAADEIERFRREMVERSGDARFQKPSSHFQFRTEIQLSLSPLAGRGPG